MENGLYVALSGQVALQQRLDTIANNVANAATAGFRAENVTFESIVSRLGQTETAYAAPAETTFAPNAGAVTQTGNALDVAIEGDGFLAIAAPGGGTAYTRDGRMHVTENGDLQSMSGAAVLDAGGAPIQINAGAGPITIARNGTISQNGTAVASLGLHLMAPGASLSRADGASFVADKPAEPVTDFTINGVKQGYVEASNVNPILEITRLIGVSRAFEQITAGIEQSDKTMSDAIRTLASGRG